MGLNFFYPALTSQVNYMEKPKHSENLVLSLHLCDEMKYIERET